MQNQQIDKFILFAQHPNRRATCHRGAAAIQHNWFPVLSLSSRTICAWKTNNGWLQQFTHANSHPHTQTFHRLLLVSRFAAQITLYVSLAFELHTSPEKFFRTVPYIESSRRKRTHVNANVRHLQNTNVIVCGCVLPVTSFMHLSRCGTAWRSDGVLSGCF